MKQVRLKFDTEHVQNILEIGGEKGLFAMAQDIGNESLKQVPLDKGTLEHTLAVDAEGDIAAISYDTPYAVKMHEHPEYHFQRGRKGKYLEDPVNDPALWRRGLQYIADGMKL